jgi:hypothetical protein
VSVAAPIDIVVEWVAASLRDGGTSATCGVEIGGAMANS